MEDTNILQLGQHLKFEIGMKIKSLKLNMATTTPTGSVDWHIDIQAINEA